MEPIAARHCGVKRQDAATQGGGGEAGVGCILIPAATWRSDWIAALGIWRAAFSLDYVAEVLDLSLMIGDFRGCFVMR